jgi:transcriptional regulator with PAS, ATPase and Fis domain
MKHTAPLSRDLTRWVRSRGPGEAFVGLAEAAALALPPGTAAFAVDAERDVIWWSPAAEALLGFSAAEILGSHCLKANRCPQCMAGCGVADHGTVQDVPLVMIDAQGAQVRVRKSGRAFVDADGRFAGAVEFLVPEGVAPERLVQPMTPAWTAKAVDFHGLVTVDPGMLQAFQILRNVAETDATVLVRGESGTGKELAARALHDESHRRDGPFRAVNCAALSPALLESELFGHVKGAFTGAVRDRKGLFAQAQGGTLFLDEVAELPGDLQAKLLRVLQERVVVPVGGNKPVAVDLRVVAATHQALREEVREGRFREDLLYRLRVVPIYLPPLRDRLGDVDLLLWHFISVQNARGPRRVRTVSPDAMRRLLDHGWPGNVRELMNVVQYAFAVGRGPELVLEDLLPEFREAPATRPTPGAQALGESARIRQALATTGGHIGEAAELLGMSRPTFWRKRKKHGI